MSDLLLAVCVLAATVLGGWVGSLHFATLLADAHRAWTKRREATDA